MKLTSRLVPFATLLFVAAIGCGSNDSQKPTNDDYDDVAQALGGVTATGDEGGETGSFYDSVNVSTGAPGLQLSIDASGKISGTRLGVTYDYNAACKDASGASMTKCDLTTDSATIKVSWSGDLQSPQLTASVDHDAELTLTELQSNVAMVSGDGSFDYDAKFMSAFRNIERDYHLSYSVAYDGIEVQRLPRAIVGGSAHYVIDAERNVSSDTKEAHGNFHIEADLSFGADGTAALTLDGSHNYTVNTQTGTISKSGSFNASGSVNK